MGSYGKMHRIGCSRLRQEQIAEEDICQLHRLCRDGDRSQIGYKRKPLPCAILVAVRKFFLNERRDVESVLMSPLFPPSACKTTWRAAVVSTGEISPITKLGIVVSTYSDGFMSNAPSQLYSIGEVRETVALFAAPLRCPKDIIHNGSKLRQELDVFGNSAHEPLSFVVQ